MLLPKAVGCECISYLRVVIENVLFPSFFFLIVNNVLSPFAFTQQHIIKQTFYLKQCDLKFIGLFVLFCF